MENNCEEIFPVKFIWKGKKDIKGMWTLPGAVLKNNATLNSISINFWYEMFQWEEPVPTPACELSEYYTILTRTNTHTRRNHGHFLKELVEQSGWCKNETKNAIKKKENNNLWRICLPIQSMILLIHQDHSGVYKILRFNVLTLVNAFGIMNYTFNSIC